MAGFANSFEKAFIPAAASGSNAALEAIKEKIKTESEKTKAATKLDSIKQGVVKMHENMVLSGQDTTAMEPFMAGISELKDPEIAELFFKSALSTAEKQKSLTDKILEFGKVAEAGKNLGNRQIFDAAGAGASSLLGVGGQATQPTTNNGMASQIQNSGFGQVGNMQESIQKLPDDGKPGQIVNLQQTTDTKTDIAKAQQGPMAPNINIEGIGSIEIDSFTGKESADGQRQKIVNNLIEERAKKSQEPLGSEVVTKFAGAVQGLDMLQKTVDNLGFYRNEKTGKVESFQGGEFKKKIAGSKAASFKESTLPLSNIKVTGGMFEGLVQMAGTDDARKIDLWLTTMAENVLRARTGAAAPEPEIVREEARSLIRLLDSPDVAFERLSVNEGFLRTVANNIRPGTISELSIPSGIIATDAKGNRAIISKDGKTVIKEL